MLNITNLPLSSGTVPSTFKPGLDPEVLGSYRPISNHTFLSKVLDIIVANQT